MKMFGLSNFSPKIKVSLKVYHIRYGNQPYSVDNFTVYTSIKHQIVHLEYVQFLCVDCISIKLKKNSITWHLMGISNMSGAVLSMLHSYSLSHVLLMATLGYIDHLCFTESYSEYEVCKPCTVQLQTYTQYNLTQICQLRPIGI